MSSSISWAGSDSVTSVQPRTRHGMTTFDKFPDLPYDLRWLIWEWCMTPRWSESAPRKVTIRYKEVDDCPESDQHYQQLESHDSPKPLQVSREARKVALAHYRPAFRPCSCDKHSGHSVWINFDADLVTMPLTMVGELLHPDLHRIKYLRLNSYTYGVSQHFLLNGVHTLDYASLKSVNIVFGARLDMRTWYGQLTRPRSPGWGCPTSIIKITGYKWVDEGRGKQTVTLRNDKKLERRYGGWNAALGGYYFGAGGGGTSDDSASDDGPGGPQSSSGEWQPLWDSDDEWQTESDSGGNTPL